MGFAIFWLFMAVICAIIGSNRKIGGVAGFFLGLFLSVIGLVIVLCSKSLADEARDMAMLQAMPQRPAPSTQTNTSTVDELQKLATLHASNAISDEEYETMKGKLINS
jgi:glycerol uptake facilitator-like aquaporin